MGGDEWHATHFDWRIAAMSHGNPMPAGPLAASVADEELVDEEPVAEPVPGTAPAAQSSGEAGPPAPQPIKMSPRRAGRTTGSFMVTLVTR